MTTLQFLFQAITPNSHASLLRQLFATTKPNQVLVSVAFLREEGIKAISAALESNAEHTTVIVGIRNDITSLQAVKRLLNMKISVIAVDTGSRRIIFHPKVYVLANDAIANIVIG